MTRNDVPWPQVAGSDSEVTSFDRKSTGSDCRRLKTGVYFAFDFLQGFSSQEAVQDDFTWRQVTGSYSELTSFDRKSLGSGYRIRETCVHCAFDFLQGCSSQEDAVTWQEMTSRHLRWPEVTSFDRKSPESGCRRPKTGV